MTEEPVDRPDAIPADVADRVEELDSRTLREVVAYGQAVLRARASDKDFADTIEPRAGEDLVRVTERDGYVEVLKRQPCVEGCDDCPHGPYLYHVHTEPHIHGHRSPVWRLVGPVVDED